MNVLYPVMEWNNPVIDGLYADPDLRFEDGVWYLYPTTDGFPHWSGTRFYAFTSRDGKHFERTAELLDVASEQVPWAVGYAWAPCMAKKGRQYYFYFCAKQSNGQSAIGAAVADSPLGPFRAQGEPLVTMEQMGRLGIAMGQTIDPSVYQEEDDAWLIFGNGAAAIAKLTPDMLHIQEESAKNIQGLTDFRESLIVTKREGLYHFTWSCDDTGSENYHVNYGISRSLYGPVDYLYPVLQKNEAYGVLGTGHHSIWNMPGEDRYLIAYHRFATPLERYPEGKGWHREVCIAPLSFGGDGRMLPVDVSGSSAHKAERV